MKLYKISNTFCMYHFLLLHPYRRKVLRTFHYMSKFFHLENVQKTKQTENQPQPHPDKNPNQWTNKRKSDKPTTLLQKPLDFRRNKKYTHADFQSATTQAAQFLPGASHALSQLPFYHRLSVSFPLPVAVWGHKLPRSGQQRWLFRE